MKINCVILSIISFLYISVKVLCQNYSGCIAATIVNNVCYTKGYGNVPGSTSPFSGAVSISKFCEGKNFNLKLHYWNLHRVSESVKKFQNHFGTIKKTTKKRQIRNYKLDVNQYNYTTLTLSFFRVPYQKSLDENFVLEN